MFNYNWNYNPDDYKNNSGILAEGDYRARISSVFPTVSQTGTSGLEFSLEVNGCDKPLKYYIWLNTDNVARTNHNLGRFFNSFNIVGAEQGDYESWFNKAGAVHVIHSEYKGRTIAKVAFCIERDKQDKLPKWQDGEDDVDEEEFAELKRYYSTATGFTF